MLPVVQRAAIEVFARTEAPSTWPGVPPSRGPYVVGHPVVRRPRRSPRVVTDATIPRARWTGRV